jgi:hypothetical protein
MKRGGDGVNGEQDRSGLCITAKVDAGRVILGIDVRVEKPIFVWCIGRRRID